MSKEHWLQFIHESGDIVQPVSGPDHCVSKLQPARGSRQAVSRNRPPAQRYPVHRPPHRTAPALIAAASGLAAAPTPLSLWVMPTRAVEAGRPPGVATSPDNRQRAAGQDDSDAPLAPVRFDRGQGIFWIFFAELSKNVRIVDHPVRVFSDARSVGKRLQIFFQRR